MSKQMTLDNEISNLVLKIGKRSTTVGELVGIDPEALSDEFSDHASRFAFVGMQTAVAEAVYEDAKLKREVMYAEIDRQIRIDFAKERITETAIKNLITMDQDYMDAVVFENDRQRDWKILRAVSDAMRQRGEQLIALGATLRAEMNVTNMSLAETKERLKR